jgi:hypothetical protein
MANVAPYDDIQMLYSHNTAGLSCAFSVLGLCILPMLPVVLENCAECTYPVPEEFSIGILFAGGAYGYVIVDAILLFIFTI